MAYTDETQISNYLQRALSAYETAELPNIIAAIKIWIDKTLNSTFDNVQPTTRYYDGGVRSLDIDPCTNITSVMSLNDDATDSYEYSTTTEIVYEPQNETVKREIRKRLSPFPRGVHRIGVTAKFSEYDSGVPADIQSVSTRIAADILQQGQIANVGNVASESLEGHQITYKNVNEIIDKVALDDPFIAGMLSNRRELYVDTYQRDRYNDDDGGLLL